MSFIGRAWRYVCRKWVKTLIVFGILVAMMTALFTTSAISRAADRVGDDVAKRTGAGFVLQNNPQFNMGTPRGAGTVKGADIEKIAALDGVKTHVARQNVTADQYPWLASGSSVSMQRISQLSRLPAISTAMSCGVE